MKKTFYLLLLTIISLFTFYGCNNDAIDYTLSNETTRLSLSSYEYDSNFKLPIGVEGKDVLISWTCDSNYIKISNDTALITRPTFEEGNQNVKLTATLKYKEETATKSFTITILCKDKEKTSFQEIVNSLNIDKIEDIKENFSLPNKIEDVDISWVSSNLSLLSIEEENNTLTAVISRPKYIENNREVILTATLKQGNNEAKKNFILTIASKEASITTSNTNYILEVGEKISLNIETTKYKESSLSHSFSNAGICWLDSLGILEAVNPGKTELKLYFEEENIEHIISIEVKVSIPTELMFDSESYLLEKGSEASLNPLIHDSLKSKIIYESTDESIITVDDNGLIKAVNYGTASIIAYLEEYELETIIDVTVTVDAKLIKVHFLNIGQADSMILELPNGEVMMIDAGYSSTGNVPSSVAFNTIKTYLDKLGIKTIDHFIITHNHQDHYALVPNILANYKVLNIYGSGSKRTNAQYLNVMNSIANANLKYQVVSVGDKLIEEENLLVQVVATKKVENDSTPNTSSVMVRVAYGSTAYMFTGDAGFTNSTDGEYIALNSGLNLRADVLKVGHHGSNTSSSDEFLDAVKPKYAVLTTVENSGDGLPAYNALLRIRNVGAQIYQTKDNGNITISSDGYNIYVSLEKGE